MSDITSKHVSNSIIDEHLEEWENSKNRKGLLIEAQGNAEKHLQYVILAILSKIMLNSIWNRTRIYLFTLFFTIRPSFENFSEVDRIKVIPIYALGKAIVAYFNFFPSENALPTFFPSAT